MTRTPTTRPRKAIRACDAATTEPVATRGSLADGAMQYTPETATRRTPGRLNVRPAFTPSPGFAALNPAVDQEFEEPMVN